MSAQPSVALLTPGEPAGIGPELVCRLAEEHRPSWVAVADPSLLADRAAQLALSVEVVPVDNLNELPAQRPGQLLCWPVPLNKPSIPGQLDVANAAYVIHCLTKASDACLTGQAQALITGPVHKGIINQAGHPFTGHTEYLRDLASVDEVVMMLASPMRHEQDWPLRVALVTTHLPLAQVPQAITQARLTQTLSITYEALKHQFGINEPTLMVLGLNPHAGEDGHLGTEELETIIPVMQALKAKGMNLIGPLPADTAFVPDKLRKVDAVVAMYHDQGLPVLKHVGFGQAVNITLGLPYIRTSVDHGTALDIAGQGSAEVGSLKAAVAMAEQMLASL